jgi:hypothetical protein
MSSPGAIQKATIVSGLLTSPGSELLLITVTHAVHLTVLGKQRRDVGS